MPCRTVYIFLKRNFFEKYCLLCFDFPRPAAGADFFWIFGGGAPPLPRYFLDFIQIPPLLVFQDFHKRGGVFQVLSPDITKKSRSSHFQRKWWNRWKTGINNNKSNLTERLRMYHSRILYYSLGAHQRILSTHTWLFFSVSWVFCNDKRAPKDLYIFDERAPHTIYYTIR